MSITISSSVNLGYLMFKAAGVHRNAELRLLCVCCLAASKEIKHINLVVSRRHCSFESFLRPTKIPRLRILLSLVP